MVEPVPRDVTVLGGGVAGIEATLALLDLIGPAARVTLVAPDAEIALDALAPVRGFDLAPTGSVSLAGLAQKRGFRVIADAALSVDTEHRHVRCDSGRSVPYQTLVVAIGARRVPVFAAGLTYLGTASHDDLRTLREDIATGAVGSVAVVVPSGVTWTLPAYELAFLLAREARLAGASVTVRLVTAEPDPLGLFGRVGSDAVAELLAAAGIDLHASPTAEVGDREIVLRPGDEVLIADRVVALPRARGSSLPGVPQNDDGFIPVDGHSRVPGCRDVYAVGDCIAFPIKQGGLAALQADVAASHIAATMGVDVPTPIFRPVMRGKLMTGDAEWYLRNPIAGTIGAADVHDEPLWMPARKVWGHYLPSELETTTGPATTTKTGDDMTQGTALRQGRPGDRLQVHGIHGQPSRRGEILEVLGAGGHERYRVRWDDDHESLVYPADGVSVIPETAPGRVRRPKR